ncbi:hypothetical protein GCK72_022355 [Caenorhabditis remanei]|uniref:Uncharacterized protein n=1 Tax=Caenorhabditis remanei TaxID=31234 RepID=A0A6A5FTI1_CAERE|nr:hypothetical protein GCK72_022355 [Caenorhabditis remanei]KAF1745908.1 hypothetical protein GCK72_022355 [Caenorhabditis remanei]
MLFYRILLPCLLFLVLVESDPTHMRLKFLCRPNITWCGKLLVYESDILEHDVKSINDFCSSSESIEYKSVIYAKGDGSPNYEWSYQLTHNCTSDGRIICTRPDENIVTPVEGTSYVDADVDVYDQGMNFRCLHPNTKRP